MKSCMGDTYFVRFTMLGDEVRKCDTCGAEYVTRARPLLPAEKGADPSLWRCGLLAGGEVRS